MLAALPIISVFVVCVSVVWIGVRIVVPENVTSTPDGKVVPVFVGLNVGVPTFSLQYVQVLFDSRNYEPSARYLAENRKEIGTYKLELQRVTAHETSGPKLIHVIFVGGVVALQPGGAVFIQADTLASA